MLTKNPFAVTSGPLPGSQKIHRPGSRADLKVAMREVVITPESGEAPIALYDTSGPYTDPNAQIDLTKGLPPLRQPWILARGDVEEHARAAPPSPRTMASSRARNRSSRSSTAAPASRWWPNPASARPSSPMPAPASSPPRWNMWRSARTSRARTRTAASSAATNAARRSAPTSPTKSRPSTSAARSRAAA